METSWADTVGEARAAQELLAPKVRLRPLGEPALVAGVDAAYGNRTVIGAACLFSYPELEFIESATAVMKCEFPYVPGLLAFREGPAMAEAVRRLRNEPDIIIVDGQGIAHPLGMGIASHLGLALGLPTIGCAKTLLIGSFREPGRKKGSHSPILLKDKTTAGLALRTRTGVKPVFVSPGHLADIEGSCRVVLQAAPRYRLTEPVRCAHAKAGEARSKVCME
jgi:deoxyribonuclease V